MEYGSGAVLDPPPENFKHIAGNTQNALLAGNCMEESSLDMFYYRGKPLDIDWLNGDKAWRESFMPLMRDTVNSGFTVVGALFLAYLAYYGSELTINNAVIGVAEWIDWWSKACPVKFYDLMFRPTMIQGANAREFMKITNQLIVSL